MGEATTARTEELLNWAVIIFYFTVIFFNRYIDCT